MKTVKNQLNVGKSLPYMDGLGEDDLFFLGIYQENYVRQPHSRIWKDAMCRLQVHTLLALVAAIRT